MSTGLRRLRLAALICAALLLLGAPCGQNPAAWVLLTTSSSQVGTQSLFTVDVVVNSPWPIQAYEFDVEWDATRLLGWNLTPHPAFDDDGSFFVGPTFDLPGGRIEQVVDLRHGGPGASGTFKVATLHFASLTQPGDTTITVTAGGLAKGDGSNVPASRVPLEISVGP